eukprot:gene16758-23031_t
MASMFFIVLAVLLAAVSSLAWEDGTEETFVYPFVYFGPNVQYTTFKEALTLGRLMNRTVILPQFFNLYLNKENGEQHLFSFEEIFDRDALGERHSVISVAELKARGWDGTVGTSLYFKRTWMAQKTFRESYMAPHARYMNLKLNFTWVMMLATPFDCSRGYLDALVQTLSGDPKDRVIGLLANEVVVPNTRALVDNDDPKDLCKTTFFEASCNLKRNTTYAKWAEEFSSMFLPKDKNYVAIHVRPFPDKCLSQWKEPFDKNATWNLTRAKELKCTILNLHEDLVPRTLTMLQRLNTTAVYLATTPSLLSHVLAMFQQANIWPVNFPAFLSNSLLQKSSVTHNLYIEQEICKHARAFIGSHQSSVSSFIVQERVGCNASSLNELIKKRVMGGYDNAHRFLEIKLDQEGSRRIRQDQAGSSRIKNPQAEFSKIKQDQAASSSLKQDQAGSSWIKKDQPGSNSLKQDQDQAGSSWIKQDQAESSKIKQNQARSSRIKQDQAGSGWIKQPQAEFSKIKQDQAGQSRPSSQTYQNGYTHKALSAALAEFRVLCVKVEHMKKVTMTMPVTDSLAKFDCESSTYNSPSPVSR